MKNNYSITPTSQQDEVTFTDDGVTVDVKGKVADAVAGALIFALLGYGIYQIAKAIK